MKIQHTYGILLKKCFLANDDAILSVFTLDYGKISIFVPKLARSKKRKVELDYLRLLELDLFLGRSSQTKKLQQVNTVSLFFELQKDFISIKLGLELLKKLYQVLPEDKPVESFFKIITYSLKKFHLSKKLFWQVFWEIKFLKFMGILPCFGTNSNGIWFDSLSKQVSNIEYGQSSVFLSSIVLDVFNKIEQTNESSLGLLSERWTDDILLKCWRVLEQNRLKD